MMNLLGILLVIAGGYVAIFNWTAPLLSRRYGRNISIVPLVGAGLMALGMLCLNVPTRYLWIPVIADFGTLMVLFVIPLAIHAGWVYCPLRRIRRFVAHDHDRNIRIDVFRSGRATIWCAFPNGSGFSYSAQWNGGESTYELFGYGSGRRLTLNLVDGVFESTEVRDPEGTNLVRDSLDGIRFTDSRDV